MTNLLRVAAAACALTLVAACGGPADEPAPTASPERAADTERSAPTAERRYAAVDDARLRAAESEPGQWMTYGGTYSEKRYSPLDGINTDNVADLGLVWYADFDTNANQQATPIVVDGVIYVSTAWSKLNAYDARTGELLWHFDPEVPGEWIVNMCCGPSSRGVAVYEGRVYLATLEGRLIALDAETGEPVWETQTFDPTQRYAITGAPRVVNGNVLIGSGGAEFGVRGYLAAFDAETGEESWRFWTVPGNPAYGFENEVMEMAAETWTGEWWTTGGGGTVWDAFTYDPVTDLLYVGVGNGSPWPRSQRSPDGGDNLFLSSIVAVNPDTGEYVWHYQTTPGESWDYTATQQIIVTDLDLDGQSRRVVMQAPKNGFFYVLDAYDGELISAENYFPVNWAEGIDMETGRPIEVPEARYDETGEGFILMPGPGGSNSWNPMSYSPDTGLVYLPGRYNNFGMLAVEVDDNPMGQNLGISFAAASSLFEEQGVERVGRGYLLAWNPVTQTEAWRVPYGEGGRGSGTLVTGGNLVFQGNTRDNAFAAFTADTGEQLWLQEVHTGIVAGAATYELDGEQFVAVVAGTGGSYDRPNYSRLLVFGLGGTTELPEPAPVEPRELNPPEATATAEVVQHGAELYDRNCGACHGADGQSRGQFPDLRYSDTLWGQSAFDAIVREGALQNNGMPGFSAQLTVEDSAAVRAYIIERANRAAQR